MSKVHEALYPEEYGNEPEMTVEESELEPKAETTEPKPKEKPATKNRYKPKVSPIQYWTLYERVLHCCGKTSTYSAMFDGIERNSKTISSIANEYEHDQEYYDSKTQKWLQKCEEALHAFNIAVMNLGQPYLTKKTGKELIFKLIFNSDYRACCYDTVKYGKKKNVILTLEEIDDRYAKRLESREKAAKKKKKSRK